ncbi:hypothetical protein ACVPOR_02265 [Staphylococcus aureus]
MVKIVVSRKIPDKFYQQLSKLGDVVMWQKSLVPMPKDQFVTALRDADACFITLSEQIDANFSTITKFKSNCEYGCRI